MSVLKDLMKASGNDLAGIPSEDDLLGDITSYIDTGSYSLNAILSGRLVDGGIPSNKIVVFAGDPAVGKTFFVLACMKQFLDDTPDSIGMYFETEYALTKKILSDRNLPTNRISILPVNTVEVFRHQASRVLNAYIEAREKQEMPRMFMALDSLGQLSTNKEVGDIEEGKDVRDMTRAQLSRGTFRVLTSKLGRANVPLVVTNHVYNVISYNSYVPTKEMGGGSALSYSATSTIFLSKSVDRDDKTKEATGNIITARVKKSRLTKEYTSAKVLLRFDGGLDRYYGLISLAAKYGVFKKLSKQYEMPDGTKVFEKEILANPTKYYTKDVMERLQVAAEQEYFFNNGSSEELSDDINNNEV